MNKKENESNLECSTESSTVHGKNRKSYGGTKTRGGRGKRQKIHNGFPNSQKHPNNGGGKGHPQTRDARSLGTKEKRGEYKACPTYIKEVETKEKNA